MPRQPTARRYAHAVFQLAGERNALDAWMGDLTFLAESLSNGELLGYLEAPRLRLAEKLSALEPALAGRDSMLRNLVGLLAQRGTVRLLPLIAAEYQRLLDGHYGRERAEVLTVAPLDRQQQERVQAYLTPLVGKEVVLTTRVDPAVLGGLMARVGDTLIDGSTRARLEELRRALEGRG